MNAPVNIRQLLTPRVLGLLAQLEVLNRKMRQAHGRGAIDPLILRHATWSKARAAKGVIAELTDRPEETSR